MTPILAGILGISAGGLLAFLAAFGIHERREFRRQDDREDAAERREQLAAKRHADLVKALADNRALTLAAVNQRARLELQVSALEAGLNDHADHLEALGRAGPARVKVGGTAHGGSQ